jgi:hypothetical protein
MATVMRRLLTGYAVTFNHRYGRHGQLFQNRYKSILCEEEPYLLELVRYIHLNPVRAKLVAGVADLDDYAYSGHLMLVGNANLEWQDAKYVLAGFGKNVSQARKQYREFVREGFSLGKRPELTGGGLIRSLGGWREAKASLKQTGREKGDERILGSSDFVDEALMRAGEELEWRQQLKTANYGLHELARDVAGLFAILPDQIFSPGKYPLISRARSLFCYWAVRELGLTATAVANELHLSQPAVSMAVIRGENLAKEGMYNFAEIRKL